MSDETLLKEVSLSLSDICVAMENMAKELRESLGNTQATADGHTALLAGFAKMESAFRSIKMEPVVNVPAPVVNVAAPIVKGWKVVVTSRDGADRIRTVSLTPEA